MGSNLKVWRWSAGLTIVVGYFSLVQIDDAAAAQVIANDLIVQGSLCVGIDCISTESFSFDTIRLKENNLRIHFDDTSTSSGFAANDWRISINGSNAGDSSYFAVDDATLGTTPFKITAGASDNALFISSIGRIGLQTSSPATNLHISDGDTPSIRLDQTNISGFTPQAWEVSGNESSFFVRNATGTSRYPLRIRVAAPTNSVFVNDQGNVGLGTGSPGARLHAYAAAIAGAEALARFEVSDDTIGRLEINNASATNNTFIPRLQGRGTGQNAPLIMEGIVAADAGVAPAVVYNASKGAGGALAVRPLVAYRNNNVVKATIGANGDVFATSFNPTSSRTMKDDIADLDSKSANEALQQLTPVKYVYKDDATGEKRLGFIAEDVPDIVANADRKSVPIMDVVALVTKVVKDQQQTIDEQRKLIDELSKRLNQVESQMQSQK